MNCNIHTCDCVVFSSYGFKIRCVEVCVFNSKGFGTFCCLGCHGIGNVACRYLGAHLSQRNRQTSNTTSTITDTLALNIIISLDPIQYFSNRLIVSITNIQLNRIHLIGFRINLIPTVETFVVEVFAYFGFVIHCGHGKCRRSGAAAGGECRWCKCISGAYGEEEECCGCWCLHRVGVIICLFVRIIRCKEEVRSGRVRWMRKTTKSENT
mmetsp:Transcript_8913/g.12329  ORF Transcript_8913/g.12329 Transcript_8913/m.12329 type:complete len:210 (+) Transcript_8913:407-1036(+)